VYVPNKRRPTGNRADMEKDEMMFEVAGEASKEMPLSGFKKPIHPKPTDLGLWKKGQVHERTLRQHTTHPRPHEMPLRIAVSHDVTDNIQSILSTM
jgi:hypothetical protein